MLLCGIVGKAVTCIEEQNYFCKPQFLICTNNDK